MDNNELLVKIWDVSHGHATYIKTPNNKHILIDLGSGSYSDGDSFSPIIHLKENYNVDVIDCCFITHPHLDHIDDILNLKEISLMLTSLPNSVDNKSLLENCRDCDKEKFKKYVNLTENFIHPVSEDKSLDSYDYWGAKITVFRSQKEQVNINDVSSVFIIEHEGLKVVIPGDNEKTSWEEFLENIISGYGNKLCFILIDTGARKNLSKHSLNLMNDLV